MVTVTNRRQHRRQPTRQRRRAHPPSHPRKRQRKPKQKPPTETETSTPDPRAENLDEIQSLLEDGVAAWGDREGGEPAIVHKDASNSVAVHELREPLHEAKDEFDRLGELTEQQQARRKRLRGCYWFLWWASDTHDLLHAARRGLLNGQSYSEDLNTAMQRLSSLKEDSDEDDIVEIGDHITPNQYEEVVNRFESEIEQLPKFEPIKSSFDLTDSYYTKAEKAYENGNYDVAADEYSRAFNRYSETADDVRETDWTSALEERTEKIKCVATGRGIE